VIVLGGDDNDRIRLSHAGSEAGIACALATIVEAVLQAGDIDHLGAHALAFPELLADELCGMGA
jgi:hypothetical protein